MEICLLETLQKTWTIPQQQVAPRKRMIAALAKYLCDQMERVIRLIRRVDLRHLRQEVSQQHFRYLQQ